ncbi:SusD family [Sphingobacterium thalpophilum]|uniref:SusD family n=2 Tax=Sphingobacterium thalpophilum TaxID=259 RepID=A0A4U9UPH0_9SPHI|nr:SusD family [Sphingobacterium thalpophilum]
MIMKQSLLILITLGLMSCSGYLDVKPDIRMDVPNTLEDCELLLNDYGNLNMTSPAATLIAGEEFYLNAENWYSVTNLDDRNAYTWSDEQGVRGMGWQGPYRTIFLANQVLQVLEKLPRDEQNLSKYNDILGKALFFRAFAYHQLAQLYCLTYDKNTAKNELGLPLKQTPDLVMVNGRSSLEDTYQFILQDYTKASHLLSITAQAKSLPNRTAAFAGLARVYLDMQLYDRSFQYADSAWRLQPRLMDFNVLDSNSESPIPKNNEEVIFSALTPYSEALGSYYSRINPSLMNLYMQGDLRKKVFYRENQDEPGTFGYKANYEQTESGSFVGLTTGEVILIRAESASRLNRQDIALKDLNMLFASRFKNDENIKYIEDDPQKILSMILAERRRELVFRGRRWADLKRLNKEPAHQTELQRTLDGKVYTLPAGSLGYAFLIPQAVIELNPTIQQNKR